MGYGGGGYGGAMGGGNDRQLYISNVRLVATQPDTGVITDLVRQLPYTVGWQDLKDLFRQAGKTGRVRPKVQAAE